MSDKDENVGVENNLNANLSEESNSNSTKNSIKRNIQRKLANSAKKNAVKKSIIKALMPILIYILLFVLAVIMIVGIVMFLITMPGMVMEQLKTISRKVGSAMSSWFGTDSTTQVKDEDVYETLDYLEQMGYDLKGYGFLTKYIGDDDDGVERDEEDNTITKAESDFIVTYLISDNYVYTIKNFNLVADNAIFALGQHIASLITDGESNKYWSRGMIQIYIDGGVVGSKYEYYDVYKMGYIKSDPETKTLEIKRGWLNNSITYNLDGWTGRYGMPIDFLLSIHLATMMPDLAYDMATGFETVINLLLHPVGGGGKDANTAIGYYKASDNDYISYDDFERDATSGISGALNAWRISNAEAMKIFKNHPDLNSPNCTYAEESGTCSSMREERTESCEACRQYLQDIYDEVKTADVSKLDTYQPYISEVVDHWYRDVYFVADKNQEFVDYDYEYESIMKERWTRYETYEDGDKAGEYKLYKVNENGEITNELYNGTSDEAAEEGIAVAKKAETILITDDEASDLNWNEVIQGKVAAYQINSSTTTSKYQAVYPREDDEIKKNIYVQIATTGNIKQTGEGQRTETNAKIKKMFLQNEYFRYDGSTESAEIITKLRKKINSLKSYYGPVKGINNDGEEVDYTNVSVEVDDTEYKVSDFSGTVNLNQDSLNAFSMLENTHTLDADYIYRDFKELIVELGFFEKEELTDETPRLLQWLIPEIGSYGFPKRELDKNEHEYGTMIHSKEDYTNKEVTAEANYVLTTPETEGGTGELEEEENLNQVEEIENSANTAEVSGINSQSSVTGVTLETTANITDEVGATEYVSKDFEAAGWESTGLLVQELSSQININTISKYYSKGNKQEYKEFVQGLGGVFSKLGGKDEVGDGTAEALYDAGEYVYGLMGIVGFNYCACCGSGAGYDYSRCTPYMSGNYGGKYDAYPGLVSTDGYTRHVSGHGSLHKLIDDCMVDYNFVTNCNYTVDKVMYKAGLMGGEGQPKSSCDSRSLVERYGGEPVFEARDLHLGDIINCYDSNGNNSTNPSDWSGFWHTMYVGEEYEDEIVIYETGHDYTNDGNWRKVVSKEAPRSEVSSGGWVGIHLWDFDIGEGNEYEGYEGNEAVVSPVTGVLLEYGTYDDEVDSITGEEYRINTDLKYGTTLFPSDETNRKIQVDKVGYAKILVLDDENYKKLELALLSKTRWDKSFLRSNGTYSSIEDLTEKMVKDSKNPWTTLEKTLYGYKEFARIYNEYGISGNVIYIDGFKCELPDEEFDIKEKGETESPSGEAISMQDFVDAVTVSDFDSGGNLGKGVEQRDSLYEKDEEYKFASEKATNKLNTESKIKDEAISTLTVGDITLIKEGTVIGRTITDRELIVDYRNEDYEAYKEAIINKNKLESNNEETAVENQVSSILGNYIRIIMRDSAGDVVENVEDYMKLDEDDGEIEQQADHFSVVGTVLSKNEWVEKALAYMSKNPGDGTFNNRANLEEMYDICVGKGVNPEFIFVRGIQESGYKGNGNNYWGYNTPNGSSTVWNGGTWQNVLNLYCDTILEYQDPSSSYYALIMERYEERSACTENGGIDPYGYGLPNSVSGIQSIYSWLGDTHAANSAGDGGMYYLYPWGWGGNQYEGENKIIFESKDEFERLCGSKHGTSKGTTSSVPTTVWEQGMYTAWQSKKLINQAKDIFGELAGTHDP